MGDAITDESIQGLGHLKKVFAAFEKLAPVGTERDTANNRTLFYSQYRPAISLKLPRGLSQPGERLLLRLIKGESIKQYDVSDRHLTSAGWHLICLDEFTESHQLGAWRVEASLVDTQLKFNVKPNVSAAIDSAGTGDSATANSAAIQVGDLYLLPWKQLKRGNTKPSWPLRLGQLAFKADGSLAALVESWTLYQWNDGLSTPATAPWRDIANAEEDIRGVSPYQSSFLVGTDSGLVALVNSDGSQQLIERAHTENGPYDSRDGVLATVVADKVHLAAVGTLRGQIKIFDLQNKTGAPAFTSDAHNREVVAIAITDDGNLLASAAGDGSLRFWKRHEDRLELLFEMTMQKNPVRQLEFSDDGQSLYTLRHGERGIRRIDLGSLSQLFAHSGLPLP